MTVSEINDVKQGSLIALEIFFINNNSYMNEMGGTPPCLGGGDGGNPCLGRSRGGTPCLGGEGETHYFGRDEGGTGVFVSNKPLKKNENHKTYFIIL